MPWCRGVAFGSVLHSTAKSPDRRALLIHVLQPLINNPAEPSGPSANAVVDMFCRSEPPPGSVSAMVARSSPLAIGGRYVRRCSSVPNRVSNLATTVCPPIAPARLIQPRASSWVTCT
ncbi:Uncharacterised protein [Mycobacterium tuberculosis]|nr:Uncharacterised protein [Mycobacterium tuberculosis]